MNNEVFSTLMYALTKHAARDSFLDFLDSWGITEADYYDICGYLKETYDVRTYV
ncbi:hypothetical protein G5B47_02320 [Paenibacillus sp. 7124]|uniref:Uncharacterized protein n=1 Tax=Paenibacillus apii TaxID=1850370 RepID=A0A6M1PGZ9_9BACL|nr:hypothetical protein [Paenibacillus apii]NGM81243.1 hypothetical protein [Paenibacillus apii]